MSDVTPTEDDGRVSERLMDLLEEWQDLRASGVSDVALHDFLDMSEDEYEKWLAHSELPVGYTGRLLL